VQHIYRLEQLQRLFAIASSYWATKTANLSSNSFTSALTASNLVFASDNLDSAAANALRNGSTCTTTSYYITILIINPHNPAAAEDFFYILSTVKSSNAKIGLQGFKLFSGILPPSISSFNPFN